MKGFRYSDQGSLFGHGDVVGFGNPGFYVEEIKRDVANQIIVDNHYSGKFYTASYIHLGVYRDGELSGVLQYGYAMNPASQESVVANTGIKEYLELNRMWLDDACPRNSESMALSYSIKYIKKKYPAIKWIQSFADERCGGFGIVYQAANFGYYGQHIAEFIELDGEIYHGGMLRRDNHWTKTEGLEGIGGKVGKMPTAQRLKAGGDRAETKKLRQFRYIYFINKRCQGDCLLERQDYPKHYRG